MAFQINGILKEAEPYFQITPEDISKESKITTFKEFSELFSLWGDSIFREEFIQDHFFTDLSATNPIRLDGKSSLSEKMSKTTVKLCRVAYRTLSNHEQPENKLDKVKKIFAKLADSISEESDALTRNQMFVLAEQPRLMLLCSEMFVKHVAEKLGKEKEIGYSADNFIDQYEALHKNEEKTLNAIRQWGEFAYDPKFTTKNGFRTLETPVKPAYQYFFSLPNAKDYMQNTVDYVAYLAQKDTTTRNGLTNEELSTVNRVFQEMHLYFSKLNDSNLLYKNLDEANKNLEEAKIALNEHLKKANEDEDKADEIYQQALKLYNEAEQDTLKDLVKERESTLHIAKEVLESKVKSNREKQNELKEALSEAEKFWEHASTLTLQADYTRSRAEEIPTKTLEMLEALKENPALVVLAMQDYLAFAKERANRLIELKTEEEASSFWNWSLF